jgi:hypothetical protein
VLGCFPECFAKTRHAFGQLPRRTRSHLLLGNGKHEPIPRYGLPTAHPEPSLTCSPRKCVMARRLKADVVT